jgi:mono/diheme cytochrome c family protein
VIANSLYRPALAGATLEERSMNSILPPCPPSRRLTARWLLLVGALVATTSFLSIAAAQSSASDAEIARGKKSFQVYCASCHGADARGEGPMLSALRFQPRDLTRLSKRNDGTFPAEMVAKVIDGTEEVKGHGSQEMPVWGSIFSAQHEGGDARTPESRIQELVNYLQSIQQQADEAPSEEGDSR